MTNYLDKLVMVGFFSLPVVAGHQLLVRLLIEWSKCQARWNCCCHQPTNQHMEAATSEAWQHDDYKYTRLSRRERERERERTKRLLEAAKHYTLDCWCGVYVYLLSVCWTTTASSCCPFTATYEL